MTVTPVRPLRRSDLPRVLAIEDEANPLPWREGDFLPFTTAARTTQPTQTVQAAPTAHSAQPGLTAPTDPPADPAAAGEADSGASARWRNGALKVAWVYGGEEVLGFACAVAVADEVELQSLAVEASARGRGIGSALLETLIEWARDAGFRTLHLEVRAGNVPALGLYRRFGFAQAGSRPAYYQDNGEDALLLTRDLGRGAGRAVPTQDF